MATITAVKTLGVPNGDGGGSDKNGLKVVWEAMGNADTGTSISCPYHNDKTIHIFGTFGAATATVQGSNEDTPTNWNTVNDDQGTPLAVTAATIALIAENPQHIRVITSGGTGTDIDVVLVAVKR